MFALSFSSTELVVSVCSCLKLYSAGLKHVEFPRGLSNGVVDLRKVADTGKGETTTKLVLLVLQVLVLAVQRLT